MLSLTAQFSFYLAFLIPAILCSFFVLYHFLFDRTLRQALNNHVIIILLITCLIEQLTIYPWMLYFYSHDDIWERSLAFCSIWTFIDWAIYNIQTIVFAWATMERHILVFHDRWVATKKKRFFIHYLPLIILLLYCFIFYFVVFFGLPCQNSVNNWSASCLATCYRDTHILYMWESIVHQIIPVAIIVIFSIALFVRILWQKYRMHRMIQWRKCRKMTVQLLSISFLYLIFYFPLTILDFLFFFGSTITIPDDAWGYTVFLSYFTYLLFPFVCAWTLPNLGTKLRNLLRLPRRTAMVHPLQATVTAVNNRRTVPR